MLGGDVSLFAQSHRSQRRRDGSPPGREERSADECEDMREGRAGEGDSNGLQDA
jgi:hypothetical protein